MIRTRFAPSPTGFVHIGNFRTALFAFLFARHNKGINILRIEDTDQSRQVQGALENLLKILKTLGMQFEEGLYLKDDGTIGERGNFGPYLQSKRLDLYQKHARELIEKGCAYYCFCSEQRLEDLRKEQIALKKPPMYDRHCFGLSKDDRQKLSNEFKAAGKTPVVRFYIPEGQTIVHDLIYGNITYEHKVLDDQVILKSDGFPTYHLAVVIDDHYMRITHVIRGEEWIPSTPKHLLIYKALGWQPTQFAHLPLILNPDKSKLSKRQGDVAVEDYLNKGYLKEALINFIAFLGWNPKTEKEIFTLDELIAEFDLAKINKSGAILDINKLDWINGLYIRNMPAEELTDKLKPYWIDSGFLKTGEGGLISNKEYLTLIAKLEQERLKKFSEIGERTKYFFVAPDYPADLLVWKKSDARKTKQALIDLLALFKTIEPEGFDKENLDMRIKKLILEKEYDNGTVFWPMRVALTGLKASPPPTEVASIMAVGLGKEEILKRIQKAIDAL